MINWEYRHITREATKGRGNNVYKCNVCHTQLVDSHDARFHELLHRTEALEADVKQAWLARTRSGGVW